MLSNCSSLAAGSAFAVLSVAIATVAGSRAALAQPSGAMLVIDSATANPGATIEIGVTLRTDGLPIAGIENEIVWSPDTALASCAVNPRIQREASAFATAEVSCDFSDRCLRTKALIISFSDLSALPDGALLYSCTVRIPPNTAPGQYPLACDAPGASDPAGNEIPLACPDSTITVSGPAVPTSSFTPATPTPTRPRTPTRTPINVVTDGGTLAYFCHVSVATDATPGPQRLACPMVGASDPNGNSLEAITCAEGTIDIGGTAAPSPPEQPEDTRIRITSVVADRGDTVLIGAIVDPGQQPVAGFENIIELPQGTAFTAPAGQNASPCTVNPDINRPASAFTFLPDGCARGECTAVRALILSFANVDCIGPCTQPTPRPTGPGQVAETPTPVERESGSDKDDGGCHIAAAGSSPAPWLAALPLLAARRRQKRPLAAG